MNVFKLNNVEQRWSSLVARENKFGKREVSANDIQTALERIFGIHVSIKDFRVGDGSCGMSAGVDNESLSNKGFSFYVRVSAFSYNTMQDFQRFRNVLCNNISNAFQSSSCQTNLFLLRGDKARELH